MTVAGTPPAMLMGGISFVTTAPAATTLPFPILTPGKMVTRDAIHTDSSMITSPDLIIEESVWIASRVTILPGVRNGKGSVVAAGAVVTKDIPPMSIAGGVPAIVIGERKARLLYRNEFFPHLYT